MAFPVPIFAGEDWLVVWLWPTIMSVVFGVFLRDRDLVVGGDGRPMLHRFVANFVVFASIWIPFQIVSAAMERRAEAQGFDSPAGWGFGVGISTGLVMFASLMIVSANVKPVRDWLGLSRNPFKRAGKA